MNAIFIHEDLEAPVEMTIEEAKKVFNQKGVSVDYSVQRKNGLTVPREELDNQPTFEGFVGPMWDGDKLRYESYKTYEMMSV